MREDSARATYDAFAPIYNEFNHLNDYEMWVGEVLLPELEKHGLKKGRALDVGCGTGRAFGPLLRRAWGGARFVTTASLREDPTFTDMTAVLGLANSLETDPTIDSISERLSRGLSDDAKRIVREACERPLRQEAQGKAG